MRATERYIHLWGYGMNETWVQEKKEYSYLRMTVCPSTPRSMSTPVRERETNFICSCVSFLLCTV